MKCITTKYIGPTNYKPSRIKAVCDGGSVTISYDYGLDPDEIHYLAADTLRRKMGWDNLQIIGSGTDITNKVQHVIGRRESE